MYSACENRTTSSKVAPEISYSGPTYIAIHSGNHDSSTAYSHGRDLVLKLEEFLNIVKNEGEVKPVGIIFSDGGPDENLRFYILRSINLTRFLFLPMHPVCPPTTKWREEWLH